MENYLSFPKWLAQRRKSLDLTRRELAELAHCSVSTLRRMEAGDLRPSKQLVESLGKAMGVPVDQIPVFTAFARGRGSPDELDDQSVIPLLVDSQRKNNLPSPLTSFIGRKQEISAICELLKSPGVRLLTITGPPGVGKTRLGIACAERLSCTETQFPDGIFFVSLAPVRTPELIGSAILRALEIPFDPKSAGEIKVLKGYLQSLNVLLILDNFEHIIAAGPQIIDILTSAPGLKVLVTSRESIQLYGEHVFSIQPLALPDGKDSPEPHTLKYYTRFPAVQLFKERARAFQPGYRLTAENIDDVVRVCTWLDGLPLAIEMAAAQMGGSESSQILTQLRDRLSSLSAEMRDLSPRQQSLEGAISWSYDLLSPDEQRLFNRVGVFSGGFTTEAVSELASGFGSSSSDTTDRLLQCLARKSMLRYHTGDHPRYSMLEVLHGYAQKRLEESSELDQARQIHAQIFFAYAKSYAQASAQGFSPPELVSRLDREIHNLHSAMSWAVETWERSEFALSFADALFPYWQLRGYVSEGRSWMTAALALSNEPTQLRAKVLNRGGDLLRIQGDLSQAQKWQEEALSIQRLLGDELGYCRSLEYLAIIAGMQGDYARTAAYLEEVVPIHRRNQRYPSLLPAMNNLAISYQRLSNLSGAEALYRESVEISKETGNQKAYAHALFGLARVKTAQGEYPAALAFCRESLEIRIHYGDRTTFSINLEAIGRIFLAMGDARRAATFMSFAQMLREEMGIVQSSTNLAETQKSMDEIRAQLGEEAFSQVSRQARGYSLEEVVRMACDDE